MKTSQVKLWLTNRPLPSRYNVTVDQEVGDNCRVVIKRKLKEARKVQSINDIIAGLDTNEELVWRGWSFEPEFLHEFHKALVYAEDNP